jgi:hypothetical protein
MHPCPCAGHARGTAGSALDFAIAAKGKQASVGSLPPAGAVPLTRRPREGFNAPFSSPTSPTNHWSRISPIPSEDERDMIPIGARFSASQRSPPPRKCDRPAPAWSKGRGGCSPGTPRNPVNIPHDIEDRRVATANDRQLNPQVSEPIRPSPQVTESAGPNVSRWRHGFEPLGLPGQRLCRRIRTLAR